MSKSLHGGIDWIMDSEQGIDKIGVTGSLARLIQDASVDLADAMLFDTDSGNLSVDLEALGRYGKVRIAHLTDGAWLGADDFMFV